MSRFINAAHVSPWFSISVVSCDINKPSESQEFLFLIVSFGFSLYTDSTNVFERIRKRSKGIIKMFNVNEKVFYPGQGVAVIESVIEKKVAGTSLSFFKLSFLYKEMTILLPIHNLTSSGVRHLSDEKTVARALDELFNDPEKKLETLDLTPSGWNKRNKDYQAKIEGGKLEEVAKIYRDIMHISKQKELSFGEKTLRSLVEELLAQEIMVVKKIERPDVLQELRNPFKQIVMSQVQSRKTPASTL